MEQIFLLTDLSDDAFHAARYAIQLRGTDGPRYTVVHAHSAAYTGDPMMPTSSMAPELLRIAEEGLREWSARLRKATGVHALEEHFGIGGVVAVLNELVHDQQLDLVVVGRSGKGGSAFFGSTAVDVMKRSRMPVLVVPAGTPIVDPTSILLADDHDDVGVRDLAMLRTIAARAGANVIVAHAEMGVPEGSPHWSHGLYEIGLKGIQYKFMSAYGEDVVDGLLRLARKEHVQMVAILHRHLDLVTRLFHPSIAKDLVLQGDRPVLVLEQS